ncbi:universal stress protein [Planctomycetota bacterium]
MDWFTKKRILVPFDFSDESKEAVKVALALAETKDDVHVLNVLAQLPVGDPYVVWDEHSDKHRMEVVRKSMGESLAEFDLANIHLDVGIGNASEKIADLAEEIGVGLIVIPSHGRTGVKRFLLGSVTERVVRLAHCPVLVLKKEN